jgi:hypothetical protein
LAALDGQPVAARELITDILGTPPRDAEYSAAHRAMRGLIDHGELIGRIEPARNLRVLVLAKPQRQVGDHDGGTVAEQQQIQPVLAEQPRPARLSLSEYTGRAWAAFGTDVGYGADIAQAGST